MKIEILKDNLKNGLSVVERVVGKNFSLPILDNVLIKTEESYLNLTSTDLETAVKIWILTKIVKNGSSVVPAKFLSSFVSLLPSEKITLTEEGQKLNVECGDFENQIQGFNPEDFPIIPEFKDAKFIEVDNKKFCQGLSQVVDIAATSQARPEISGIYFVFSKKILKIAATDSFRLGEKNIALEQSVEENISFILPQKPAKEIVNILQEKGEKIRIYFSANQIMFEVLMPESNHPQIQIISRLIDGEYPNYQEIIPTKFKSKIVIKRDDFLNQVKAASLFSGKINEVKIKVNSEKKSIDILSQDPDLGKNQSKISAKIEGEDLEVSFNHKFLIDGLNNIKSSEIGFEISGQEGPCILKPIGDTSYIYVVMPIKST